MEANPCDLCPQHTAKELRARAGAKERRTVLDQNIIGTGNIISKGKGKGKGKASSDGLRPDDSVSWERERERGQ